MNIALQTSATRLTTKTWMVLLLCLYSIILCVSLQHYFNWASPVFLFGVTALFFVTTINKQHKGSTRFAYAAGLFSVLNLFLPVKTILFVSMACAMMFTIENLAGKMGFLPLVITALVSPAFQYLSDVFTFPVRLQLTAWAGKALQLNGTHIVTEGNVIICNGNEFSVDPACMGVNMMVTSLITGVVLIALYQNRFKKTGSAWLVVLILSSIATLNILSNLFRIVCLVQFSILPQTWLHDIVGIICFSLYVILPASCLCKWMIRSWGKSSHDLVASSAQSGGKIKPVFHVVVACCIFLSSYTTMKHDYTMSNPVKSVPAIGGYSSRLVDENIIKLENAGSLVYIKRIPGFYAADHTPMICWRGSGYDFKQISEVALQGTKVYSGVLQKGNEQLYTIWWYANKKHNTIRQLEWRWDVLNGGENYSIVNITCSSEKLVRQEAEKILDTRRFNILLR